MYIIICREWSILENSTLVPMKVNSKLVIVYLSFQTIAGMKNHFCKISLVPS